MAVARMHSNPQYLRSGEAARQLGVSVWTLRSMVRDGLIDALKTNTARQELRFRRSEVERVRREWEENARSNRDVEEAS